RRIDLSPRLYDFNQPTIITYLALSSAGRGGGARLLQLPLDAIVNPVRIPPFDRVHRAPVDEHREVEMIAAGKSGHAAPSDRLAARHGVADLYVVRRQMSV